VFTIEILIKEVRETTGISLRKLEEETGIEREHLSDIEYGKIPTDKILFIEMVIISKALACSITDLYIVKDVEIK